VKDEHEKGVAQDVAEDVAEDFFSQLGSQFCTSGRCHLRTVHAKAAARAHIQLELELIQPNMAQKPVLRGEVGCASIYLLPCFTTSFTEYVGPFVVRCSYGV